MTAEHIPYMDFMKDSIQHQLDQHRAAHYQMQLRAERESPDESSHYEEQDGTRIIVHRRRWLDGK